MSHGSRLDAGKKETRKKLMITMSSSSGRMQQQASHSEISANESELVSTTPPQAPRGSRDEAAAPKTHKSLRFYVILVIAEREIPLRKELETDFGMVEKKSLEMPGTPLPAEGQSRNKATAQWRLWSAAASFEDSKQIRHDK